MASSTSVLDELRRFPAVGLMAGPAAFVGAWALGGWRLPGYSPVHDAISRIAAEGGPHRSTMTAGFVAYGAWLLAAVPMVRRSTIGRIWPAVLVNGVSTLAVAALPLDRSDAVDLAHGVAATVGYVSLAAVPALAAGPLHALGHRAAARVSLACSVAIAVSLALTVVLDAKGAAQRTGLSIGDLWLAATGGALLVGRLWPGPARPLPAVVVEPVRTEGG